jgi:hypothetical protein
VAASGLEVELTAARGATFLDVIQREG